MKSRHSARRASMGSGLDRDVELPSISSWPRLYISIKSSFPSSVFNFPELLFLISCQRCISQSRFIYPGFLSVLLKMAYIQRCKKSTLFYKLFSFHLLASLSMSWFKTLLPTTPLALGLEIAFGLLLFLALLYFVLDLYDFPAYIRRRYISPIRVEVIDLRSMEAPPTVQGAHSSRR